MMVCFLVSLVLVIIDTDQAQLALIVSILVVNTVYSSINAIFQVFNGRKFDSNGQLLSSALIKLLSNLIYNFVQASFLSNIGRFPSSYIGSANDGMGLGGIIPAAMNILVLGR